MKLSIIIPVYKVEKYIAKCIDSIMSQCISRDDYEVIIINDGSPDDSKQIILEYIQKYSNIIFIDQENQGVSIARNRGLDIAKGDYILFVDPDDSIHENSIDRVLNVAYKQNLDMLYLSLKLYDEEGNFVYLYPKVGEENVVCDGIKHPRRTFPATLYKRNTIAEIRFFKGITRGQDTVFNAMVQSVSKRCSYSSIPYYRYLDRSTSSKQFVGNEKAFVGCMIAINELENFKSIHFPILNHLEREFFREVELLFLQRALEWNIMPELDRKRFFRIRNFLKNNNLSSLATDISCQFPFFNKSYFQFYLYHRIAKHYYRTLGLLSKIKRSIFH